MDTIFDFSVASSAPQQQEALADTATAAFSPSLNMEINRLMCDLLATRPTARTGEGGGQGGAAIDLTMLQLANYQRQQHHQQLQLHQNQLNPLLLALANMQFNRQVTHLPSQLGQLLLASQQQTPLSQASALNELTSVASKLTSPAESLGSRWHTELGSPARAQKTPSTLAELLATSSTIPSATLQRICSDAATAATTSPPSAKRARPTPASSSRQPPVVLHHPPLPASSPPAHSITSSSSLSSSTQNSPQLAITNALGRRPSNMSTTSTTKCSSPMPSNRGGSIAKNSSKSTPHTPPNKTSSTPQRKPAAPIPPEKKDASYYERRRKNNDAAKRSRDARRQKEEDTSKRADFLEEENAQLKGQIGLLKAEIAKLHTLLVTAPCGIPNSLLHHHHHDQLHDNDAYTADTEHDTAALTLEISHATLGDGHSDNGVGTSSSGGSSVNSNSATTDRTKREDA